MVMIMKAEMMTEKMTKKNKNQYDNESSDDNEK